MAVPESARPLTPLTPPDGWAVVEPHVYRASSLEKKAHLGFLRQRHVRTVVNMSSAEPVNGEFAAAAAEAGMAVVQPCLEQADARSPLFEEVVKEALEFILRPAHQPLVLTVAGGGVEVCTLVGCLRRLQHWSLTAILYEYRVFAPTAPMYDVHKQFVERFDVSLVTLGPAADRPEWLTVGQSLFEEEERLWLEQGQQEEEAQAFAAHPPPMPPPPPPPPPSALRGGGSGSSGGGRGGRGPLAQEENAAALAAGPGRPHERFGYLSSCVPLASDVSKIPAGLMEPLDEMEH